MGDDLVPRHSLVLVPNDAVLHANAIACDAGRWATRLRRLANAFIWQDAHRNSSLEFSRGNLAGKLKRLVGPARFELATSCTPSKRASQAAPRPELSIVHVIPANPAPPASLTARADRPSDASPRPRSRTTLGLRPSGPAVRASGRRENTPA